MKIRSYLRYSVVCIFLTGCTYDYIEITPVEELDLVSYQEHVVPILETNCISCHNGQYASPNLMGDGSYQELIDGGYLNITDVENSKLIIKLNDNHPYVGTPSQNDIDLIVQWIEEGALNN